MTTNFTLIPFNKADTKIRDAIKIMAFDIFANETDMAYDDLAAFANRLNVRFTQWNFASLAVEFDELTYALTVKH